MLLILAVHSIVGVPETLAIGPIGLMRGLRPLPTLPLLLRRMLAALLLRFGYDVALAVISDRGLLLRAAVHLTFLDIATPLILILHPGCVMATIPSTLSSGWVLEVGMTLGFLVLIM